MSESKPLTGRVALVTGSSSGIGKAIAFKLAEQGAKLIVHGSQAHERLKATVLEIRDMGAEADLVSQDFRDGDAFSGFAKQAWDIFDRIDILVNNAGADVLTGDAAKESFDKKFETVWQVDVRATLLLSRAIGNLMAEQFSADESKCGSIVNIGWDQAWQGMAGDSGEMFAASKGAIMATTKSLAQSLAPTVRVNCVAPGWIKTKWGEEASQEWSDRAVSESLMNRWGTPEDVANAVTFLAGDQASFISGQIISVNGGFRFSK